MLNEGVAMKILFKCLFVTILICIITSPVAEAQNSANNKEADMQAAIKSRDYIFYAQYATPQSGRQIPLTSNSTLTLKDDTLISYFPYFGRAYTAPVNPNENSIEFTSTKFSYTAKQTKKGGYNVVIKPKDEKMQTR